MQPTWADVIERKRFETSHADPASTLNEVCDFIDRFPRVQAIGFACFGPLDPDTSSATYGHILATPKLAWANRDVLGHIKARFPSLPSVFNTDVNAAALSEVRFGEHVLSSGAKAKSAVYVTVGTGVGIGIVVDNTIIKGLSHPEGGHICVRRQPGDSYAGNCPFHNDCLEGMANSKSIADRVGCTLKELIDVADSDPVWRTVAFYLAQMCVALTCLVTPEVIVLGGGILNRGQLYRMVQEEFQALMNDYLVHPRLTTKVGVEKYICASRFGSKAGAIGSVILAKMALEESRATPSRL